MRRVISQHYKRKLAPHKLQFARDLLGALRPLPQNQQTFAGCTIYMGSISTSTFRLEYADEPGARRRIGNYQQRIYVDGTLVAAGHEGSSSIFLCRLISANRLTDPRNGRAPVSSPPPPVQKDPEPPRKGVILGDNHVFVHGVRLHRWPAPGPLTPTKDEIGKLVGVDTELKTIAAAVARRMPVLLIGDSGTGKTSIITYLAHICNANLIKVVGDPEYGPSLWLGHLHAKDGNTYWVDGDLPTAMKGVGGNGQTWLFVDELSRMLPDNTAPLFPVLERRGGHLGALRLTDNPDPEKRVVRAHPDFRVLLAMNPFDGDFVGTHEQDLALLRRVGASLEIKYPSAVHQMQILRALFPSTPNDDLQKVVNVSTALRAERVQRRISFPCSPDVLENWLELTPVLGLRPAADVCLVNKAAEQDKPRLNEILTEKLK